MMFNLPQMIMAMLLGIALGAVIMTAIFIHDWRK